MNFEKTYLLELLESLHQNFIEKNAKQTIEFEFNYPNVSLSTEDLEIYQSIINKMKPFWRLKISDFFLFINDKSFYVNQELKISPSLLVFLACFAPSRENNFNFLSKRFGCPENLVHAEAQSRQSVLTLDSHILFTRLISFNSFSF